ncbi:hypothetical protein U1Q18_046863 [Sarracenia purpurea var. burkii]
MGAGCSSGGSGVRIPVPTLERVGEALEQDEWRAVVGCANLIAAPLRSEDERWSVTAVNGGARRTVTTAWFSDEWSLVPPATMSNRG